MIELRAKRDGATRRPWFPLLALAAVVVAATLGAKSAKPKKEIIGATAELVEVGSGVRFPSRVDTGAKTCSLHVEEWQIEGEVDAMRDNKGKPIRFRVVDQEGKDHWIESKVAGYAIYKTSEEQERRYKVRLRLRWNELEKEVLVNLNDRSHLEFPLLLGRNYLRGDLLVDVDVNNPEL